jgi:hypothetical protein
MNKGGSHARIEQKQRKTGLRKQKEKLGGRTGGVDWEKKKRREGDAESQNREEDIGEEQKK